MPVFLPIWIWAEYLMENITGNEHIFFDGVSRRLVEANVLDSALKFYERKKPTIISFDVSDEWSIKLMKGRGRADDTDEEMKRRLAWYKENTMPAIEYFKNDPDYKFISVNGEQTIEEVHQEIMEKVRL
jgi:adenylate kinase